MGIQNDTPNKKVLIFLAPGFEEITTIDLLVHLREIGLSVSLVSLAAGLVTSRHGLKVRPDYSLEQLSIKAPYQLIIVPGGQECTPTLVMDPRVRKLIEATLHNDGFVAATLTAEPLITQMNIPSLSGSSRFIPQRDMADKEFINVLVNLLSD